MNARQIIRRPLITEKGTLMQEASNVICFEVDRRANKIEIAKAVEELFGVHVLEVRVVNRKGKPVKRYGRVTSHRPTMRKAYVRLTPDSKTPEFFEGI
jgi:large subunit ribosomal protein L23